MTCPRSCRRPGSTGRPLRAAGQQHGRAAHRWSAGFIHRHDRHVFLRFAASHLISHASIHSLPETNRALPLHPSCCCCAGRLPITHLLHRAKSLYRKRK